MTALPKKIWGTTLLLLVAVPILFSAVFLISRQLQQDQMQEKMEQSVLQTIQLPASQVKWISAGKEILVDGKLFDVSSSSLQNGVYSFTGLFDSDEDNMVRQFQNNWQQSRHNPTPLESMVIKYLAQTLFNGASLSTIQHSTCCMVPCRYPRFSEPTAEALQTTLAPPPKTA